MPANQTKVKAKLAAWLRVKEKADISHEFDDVRDKSLIPKLTKTRKEYFDKIIPYLESTGHCFGFSIARGAMVLIGYKAWWDEITDIVEKTDVATADFNKKMTLKSVQGETTLEIIFTKVINFIVPSQVSGHISESDFLLKGVSQFDFIKNCLEILGQLPELKLPEGSKETVLKVKDWKIVGGHMPLDVGTEIFNLADTEGLLCIAFNHNHAIEFDIKNGESKEYNLCDSNYQEKIYYPHGNIRFFIDNVIHRLGESYGFIVLSFNKKLPSDLFSHYDKLFNEKPAALVNEKGLLLFTSELRDKLDALVKNILASKEVAGPNHIGKALGSGDGDRNGLTYLSEIRPDLLTKLIEYVKKSYLSEMWLGEALKYKSKKHASAFAFMAINNKAEFPGLLAVVEKSHHWDDRFVLALSNKDENDQTALAKLVMDSSVDLKLIFDSAAKCLDTAKYIAKSLSDKADDEWIIFHAIVSHHENALNSLFKVLSSTKDGCDELAKVLSVQTPDKWSGLRMLMRYSPDKLIAAIDIAKKSKLFDYYFAKALLAKSEEDKNIFMTYDCSHSSCLQILKIGEQLPVVANAITSALLTKNKDGFSAITLMKNKDEAEKFLTEKQYIQTVLAYDAVFESVTNNIIDYVTGNYVDDTKVICKALVQTDKNGDWVGLLVDKPQLLRAITYVHDSKEWPETAAKILKMKNSKGESVYLEMLWTMEKLSDDTLTQFLSLTKIDEARFVSALVEIGKGQTLKDPSSLPGLLDIFTQPGVTEYLIQHFPHYVENFMSYLHKSKSDSAFLQMLELLFKIEEQPLIKFTWLNKLIEYSHHLFQNTSLANQWSRVLTTFLCAKKSENQLSVFNLIESHLQLALTILYFIAKNALGFENITRIFKQRDEHQKTVIDRLMANPKAKSQALHIFRMSAEKESSVVLNLFKAEFQTRIHDKTSYYYFGPVKPSDGYSLFCASKKDLFMYQSIEIIEEVVRGRERKRLGLW